jgi:hypothetical protein
MSYILKAAVRRLRPDPFVGHPGAVSVRSPPQARHSPAPAAGLARDGTRRARPDLPACPQRPAGIRGDRRRHRAPGPGTRHRTLVITRKGGKVVTIPLAPRTARAIDLAIGQRTEGRSSSPPTVGGWTGTAPPASSPGSPAAPGSASMSALTRCGTRSSPLHLTPEYRCGMCRRPPRTPILVRPCATTGHAPAWTGTPHTLSPPLSPGQPVSSCRRIPDRSGRPAVTRPIRDKGTQPTLLPAVAVSSDREPRSARPAGLSVLAASRAQMERSVGMICG